MKNSYYFPHDYHARFDPKLCALIKNFGMEGYGTWWMLVEILHEQGGKIEKFPKLYEGLAHDLKQNEAHLKQIIYSLINDYKLLDEDTTHIWSSRVLRNINDLNYKRTQKAEAGRLGGIISGKKRSKTKQNEAPLEADEQKESKVKESKVKESNIPPTIQEVADYCQERNNGIDPNRWFNHYQAKGWMIGKNKMKDWKAAVRTWEVEDKPEMKKKAGWNTL